MAAAMQLFSGHGARNALCAYIALLVVLLRAAPCPRAQRLTIPVGTPLVDMPRITLTDIGDEVQLRLFNDTLQIDVGANDINNLDPCGKRLGGRKCTGHRVPWRPYLLGSTPPTGAGSHASHRPTSGDMPCDAAPCMQPLVLAMNANHASVTATSQCFHDTAAAAAAGSTKRCRPPPTCCLSLS
mmetsp:Transcript_20284/g.51360  ORF Transcript_20284/g.51360 Transcript_20284/m.51360 type:complete len:184 (-) Transcript_20284:687-1238(-)